MRVMPDIGTFPRPRTRHNRGGRPRTGRPLAYPPPAGAAQAGIPPSSVGRQLSHLDAPRGRDPRFAELDALIAADEREQRARAKRLGLEPHPDVRIDEYEDDEREASGAGGAG